MCAVTEPSALPPCDTGCTESMVGLLNIEPKREIWELLRVNPSFTTCTDNVCDFEFSLLIHTVLDIARVCVLSTEIKFTWRSFLFRIELTFIIFYPFC